MMTREQREVLEAYLAADKTQREVIKQAYAVALADIKAQAQALMGKVQTSSVLYQLQYKKAMAEQIEGILTLLESQLVTDTTDYLASVYDNGFYGSAYAMAAQGVPIAFGVDQKQLVAAINHKIDDYKFSDRIRANVDQLKRVTKMEITRGIANGSTYAEIAKHIAQHTDESMRRAQVITRTEAHRVQQTARMDAMHEAKKRGADVVKMWDSTLDGKTRRTHRKLDGQIRELDEPFEVDGHKAMRPGGFGRPEEDINCRCAILERARWALKGKRRKLDNEHQYNPDGTLNYVSTDDKRYQEWKAELEQALQAQQKKPGHKPKHARVKVEGTNMPGVFTATPAARKRTQALADYINGIEGADPDVVRLYAHSGQLDTLTSAGVPLKVRYADDGHALSHRVYLSSGKIAEATVTIPKMAGDNLTGQAGTTIHEMGHLFDLYADRMSESNSALQAAMHPQIPATIPPRVQAMFDGFHAEYDGIRKKAQETFRQTTEALRDDLRAGRIKYAEYAKRFKEADKAYKYGIDYDTRNAGGGIDALEDIYDALTGGKARDEGRVYYGHGGKYYKRTGMRESETFANYMVLSITRPDLVQMLEEDQPGLVQAMRGIVDELNERIVDK